jgi:hypothetical protein
MAQFQKTIRNSYMMWTGVLGGTIIAFLLLIASSRSWGAITRPGVGHWLVLVGTVIPAVCLTAAPFIRFLDTGWNDRLTQYKNSIRGNALVFYLRQFWQGRLDLAPGAVGNPALAEGIFNDIYVSQYGRRAFVAPIILLLVVTFISSVLVVQTGIDTCIEHRCLTPPEVKAADPQSPNPPLVHVVAAPGTGGRFAPLGDITLQRVAVAAIAGAFLFVVSDAILRARWRTLNISDVYWYVLRTVLAVPIGLALSEVALPAVAGLVAFGFGAFPADTVIKLFQRLTNKSLGGADDKQEADQLVQIDGITVSIAATLAADGVMSIDELIGADPVLLSIRTGIPLSSIFRFASQAVVRLHFGERANQLIPIALGNAYFISDFVTELDTERSNSASADRPMEQRLLDATIQLKKDSAATVPSKVSVEAGFRLIQENGYSKFLTAID